MSRQYRRKPRNRYVHTPEPEYTQGQKLWYIVCGLAGALLIGIAGGMEMDDIRNYKAHEPEVEHVIHD